MAVATDDNASEHPPWSGDVRVHGALRAMFHEGQIGSVVGLDALLPSQDLYGVGALADLAGEITIVAGQAYLSRPSSDGPPRTETVATSRSGAALLVTTQVGAWQEMITTRTVDLHELEAEVEHLVAGAGLDPKGRIPFLITGVVASIQWHVIDGSRLSAGGDSHEDHLAASSQDRAEGVAVTIVGFYSPADQGIFTHMGSKLHLHCVLEEPLRSGHVDQVVIPQGTIIRFPLISKD